MRKAFLIILLLFPCLLFAQTDEKQDVWKPLRFFVGKWEGEGKGCPGVCQLKAESEFIFDDKFLEIKGKAVFKPQEKNPKGGAHEDIGFISYDQSRKKFVLRQFHAEGFVNQYVLDSISPDEKTFIFLSENMENMPAGWRARVTYRILNDKEFTTVFELAGPGQDFQTYVESQLKRKS
jgi:hypothetical protein